MNNNKVSKMVEQVLSDFELTDYFKKIDKRKQWNFINLNNNKSFEFIINDRSLQNRHECIFNGLLDILLRTNSFDYYYELIYDYVNNDIQTEIGEKKKNINIWLDNIDKFNEITEEYIKIRNIDFSKFAKKKKRKNSIFFDETDIKEIYKLSILFKLFFFGYSTNHKLSQEDIKKIMTYFTKTGIKRNIFSKINSIIQIRMLKYKLTDGEMINRIARNTSTPFETYSLYIFNLITNYIIIGYDLTNNPINYFLGAINKSLDWFLRTIYTKNIIYYDIDKKIIEENNDFEGSNQLQVDKYSSNIEMSSVDFIKNTYYKDITNKIIFYIYNWLEQKNNKFNINLLEFVINKTDNVRKNFIMQEMMYSFLEKIINVKNNYFNHMFIKDQYIIQIFTAILLKKSELVNDNFVNFLFYGNTEDFNFNNNFKSKQYDIFMDIELDTDINKILLYKFISNVKKFLSYDFIYLLGVKSKNFKNEHNLFNEITNFMIKLLNDDFDWKKLKSIFFDMISEIEYDDTNKNTIIFDNKMLYNNNESSDDTKYNNTIIESFYI
jgi:hypothetical protein